MSQMSNLITKLANESNGVGLTIEGFLEDRKRLSKASHKTAISSLKEIEGYLISQGETLTSVLEDLVQLNKQSIAITARLNDEDMLHVNIKRERRNMQGFEVKLHGASSLSKKSYCFDCSKPIIDQSRTRPKKRCDICKQLHIKKINKIHAERTSKLKHQENELQKMKKLNATGTIV